DSGGTALINNVQVGQDTSANSAVMKIMVTPKDEPVANPDTAIVVEGSSVQGNVLVNDTPVDSTHTLSVSSVDLGVNLVGHSAAGKYGTLTLNADGTYSYLTSDAAPGGVPVTDTFTYTVTDHRNGTDA